MNKKLICPKKNDSDLLIPFMIVACGVLLSCITVFFGYDILSDYQDKLVYLFKKAESIGIVSDELYFPATWNREASYDMVPVTDDGNVISDFKYEKYRWTVNVDGGYGISEIISLLMLMLLIHHRVLERHKHKLPES